MKKIVVTSNKKASMEDFYGIFFEDLNHAADGGLYAEKVRNRAFEFSPADNSAYQSLTAWKKIEEGGAVVAASVWDKAPYSKKNPHYLVLEITNTGKRAGIKNLGYNSGIAVEKGKSYNFSCYAKSEESCLLRVSVDDAYGKEICGGDIEITSKDWMKYTLTFIADTTNTSAVLSIAARDKCKVCLDFVSLFPQDTFRNRENGMRRDLSLMLKDLKPKFMRFPGGCLVHDGSLCSNDRNSMYRWKNTIGDITERPSRRNNWRYNQSLGIGYYEYFVFCEDIGAKPLPVLPAGYNPHMEQAAPISEMQEWIDDALDLIEFANGGSDTKWGKIRADLGHEAPFNLEYLAIGNEEVGALFWERYDIIHKAVRDRYPQIKLINSSGPFPTGGEFERGWANARKNKSDLVDEHYYCAPEWMLANTHRYDAYPQGPKVFLGEYASWGNKYRNALCEAAYLTGVENNADKVGLVCYAPLLSNTAYNDWSPVMIWFDNYRVYGSANYYLWKMFMTNTGLSLLETRSEGFDAPVTLGEDKIEGGIDFTSNNIEGSIYDITLTDLDTNNSTRFDALTFSGSETKHLTETDMRSFKLSFKVKRSLGLKGFNLEFGKKDKDNFVRWFIGGWQNQDSEISSVTKGKGATLAHEIFSLMTDREYNMCLEVRGRKITTYIDGKKINTAEHKRPVVEDLYYTASEDDDNIYIKVVNVKDRETTARITLCGIDNTRASLLSLTADLEAENSFDAPKTVYPKESEIKIVSNAFEYEFPSQSVTVFKIAKHGAM